MGTFLEEIRKAWEERLFVPRIQMEDDYDYDILGRTADNHDYLLDDIVSDILELKNRVPLSKDQEDRLVQHVIDVAAKFVFGSNMISGAGASLEMTRKLCRAVVHGEAIPNMHTDHPDYAALKQDLMQQRQMHAADVSFEAVLQARDEILQHARAVMHIITELYLVNQDLNSSIILDTHRILTHHLDAEDGTSWSQYSGMYRTDDPTIPASIEYMILTMNEFLANGEAAAHIDPVAFATRASQVFASIHPFHDGNGRMSRLILIGLLLSYGGNIIHIGLDEDDRKRYWELTGHAASMVQATNPDGRDRFRKLASFIMLHYAESMHELVRALAVDEDTGMDMSD